MRTRTGASSSAIESRRGTPPKRSRPWWLIVVLGALAAAGAPSAHAQEMWKVSVDSAGVGGDGPSGRSDLSRTGRYVAFDSRASNLVAGDTNGFSDVFWHDRKTGLTVRVSVDSQGVQANGESSHPSISADGRYVAFHSLADNLVSSDINQAADVFVRDVLTGSTTRVSLGEFGNEADDHSSNASISGDGSRVAFQSAATNLSFDDLATTIDIFVRDRVLNTTTLCSRGEAGKPANGNSSGPSLSADGTHVAFESYSDNITSSDTNGDLDVYVYDLVSRVSLNASRSMSGPPGNRASYGAQLSADAGFVAFTSGATDLVPADTNSTNDIFRFDLQTGAMVRVSVGPWGEGNGSSGGCSIADDGRSIAFFSNSSNLTPQDPNQVRDIFEWVEQGSIALISRATHGGPGNAWSEEPAISGDGHFCAFSSFATDLVPADTSIVDVFLEGNPFVFEVEIPVDGPDPRFWFDLWTGMPHKPLEILVTRFDDEVVHWPLLQSHFDARGHFQEELEIPPEFVGHTLELIAIGVDPSGSVRKSAEVEVEVEIDGK